MENNVNDSDQYFCTDCKPDYNICGLFDEIFMLVHDTKNDKYEIGDIRGHAIFFYTFPEKPTKDVLNLESDEGDDDALLDLSIEWTQKFSKYRDDFKFHPTLGSEIYNMAINKGWSQNKFGDIFFYFVNEAGKLIEQYEQRINKLSTGVNS